MRKYIRNILLFFIAVVIVDLLFGMVCQYMNDHSKGGGVKSRYYVCKESNEEVLVFGSSRAKHHYVPGIIEDSLGMTCYNAGEDGNGIIYCYGVLKMMTQRYAPKLIIYDVTAFDIYQDDNMKYIDLLKPYYFESGVDSIFWIVEPKTRLMMHSNLYRYNTTCLRVIGNYLHAESNSSMGYSALTGIMDYESKQQESKQEKMDITKMILFKKFVQLTKEHRITLICTVSPSYKAPSIREDFYNPIKQICYQNEVPFLFYESEPEISVNKVLFKDRIHLNDEGAQRYTEKLISEIKTLIK